MNWEETIIFARKKAEYHLLIKHCYLTDDLDWNSLQYRQSKEYKEILDIIRKYAPGAKSILEFGAGNGIASVNFALDGYDVTSSEPDNSETVGTGAIKKMIQKHELKNIKVVESYAENIDLPTSGFDIVFARQCMHHANDLEHFTKNAHRLLKPGGLFLTVRDHVINSESNRQEFLNMHPFHKYYGGENAFSQKQYEAAIKKAGFKIEKVLRYFDSVINFSPETNPLQAIREQRIGLIIKKFPLMAKFVFTRKLLLAAFTLRHGRPEDDKNIIGRMYSFIAIR